jgi:hypothetical protein
MNITVTKLGNGALELTAIVNNQFIRRVYYFYRKREAIRLFKKHIGEKSE